jgi:hypothetical protein
MSKNNTAKPVDAIVSQLVEMSGETSTFLKKKGEVYTAAALSMAEEGIDLTTLAERMKAAKGSDWPKDEKGEFVGMKKARDSQYGKALNRFLVWFNPSFKKDKDGVPLVDDNGELVKIDKSKGPQDKNKSKDKSKDKSKGKDKNTEPGDVTTLSGYELQELGLREAFKALDKMRAEVKPQSRAGKELKKALDGLTLAATLLEVKL